MLLSIAKLIVIIRVRETLAAENAGAVSALMMEFRVVQEIDFPAFLYQPQAEIDVFVPGWEKSLIEAARLVVRIPPHEQCRCCRLVHPSCTRKPPSSLP